MGIPDEYGSKQLAEILADFSARYPAVEVSVRCGFSAHFPKAIATGRLDLAVVAALVHPEQANVLVHDPMVWAASNSYVRAENTPLPLALFDQACAWRDAATDALDTIRQPYRIAFSSESTSGIKAAIETGLAVGVLARSAVEPTMRTLDEQDELPPLPDSVLTLQSGKNKAPAIDAMADAIRRGFTAID